MCLALALAAGPAVGQDAGAPTPAAACTIDVEVTGLKAGGAVWVLLFSEAQAKAFPTKRDQAQARVDVAPAAGVAKARFEGLGCGQDYAVAVVHDEDGDGRLRTNFLGIPNEGLGASRNATGTFGPPKFSDAKVRLAPGVTRLPIAIVY